MRAFLVGLVRVFGFTFAAVFLTQLQGVLAADSLATAKAAGVAAASAALATAIKAVVDVLTKGVSPLPSVGMLPQSLSSLKGLNKVSPNA